jgi:PIN domain nuclease of toxin-antitoxin system
LIQIDTCVAIWLYEGKKEKLSPPVVELIESQPCQFSPMVRLELQYMFEIGRNGSDAATVVVIMRNQFGIEEAHTDFSLVVQAATTINWTRDPFDRLIAAQAICDKAVLVTKDRTIRQHCPNALW